MTHLFYLFAILFISRELLYISDPVAYLKLLIGRDYAKPLPTDEKELSKIKSEVYVGFLFTIVEILYSVWAIVGLFSSQYILFAAILLISVMGNIPWLKYKTWRLIDSCMCIVIMICIIYFKYHA